MKSSEFSVIASRIPGAPGVYRYYDTRGELIYVGKAKNLKKRVSSYFQKTLDNKKTIELVKRIARIEFTVVDSEEDAFFLECTLIKEYRPHYNIQFKDDKHYPHVVIKNERFPRVFITRKKYRDGSTYFGPYTSSANIREILGFIKTYFPLRNCRLALTEKNISAGKFKVCLEYHLGHCKGPCENRQSESDYMEGIERLKEMLRGNVKPLVQKLKTSMQAHAEKLEFEKAEQIRQKLEELRTYKSRSVVVNSHSGHADVFSILDLDDRAYVNHMAVRDGSIIHTRTLELEKRMDETASELLVQAVGLLRQSYGSNAPEIIVPFDITYPEEGVTVTVPKVGDKRKLLDLSHKNVNLYEQERSVNQLLHADSPTLSEMRKILEGIRVDLHLPEVPDHIECFDNSNIQGSSPVAAMVCFRSGMPSKNDYRRFHIRTVEGIDDFASMKEIVGRRYKRLSESGGALPQLVIIDGGKGQLNAAYAALKELHLHDRIPMVGLAKNKEEIFFIGDQQSLMLDWNSESLKLIRRIRDEVHRFGIRFHRNTRSRNALQHELDRIPGIGTATLDTLLSTFKSMRRIKEATLEQLAEHIGMARAKRIQAHIKQKDPD